MPTATTSVELYSIAALTLNLKNARIHPKRQITQLKNSIKTFGFNTPVLIDSDGLVIAGHGRIAAAKELGWTEVPAIRLDHLSSMQVKAYTLADNKITQNATWDQALLAEQLQELSMADLDFDIEITGFEIGEIDMLLHEGKSHPSADDALPDESKEPPVAHRGDVWQLGPHRIICGDALDMEDYTTLFLLKEKAQVVFTDPPYNVAIEGNVGGKGRIHHREFAMASGEMSHAQFSEFLRSASSLMARYSYDSAIHYQCIDWRHLDQMIAATRGIYSEVKNVCVWVKDNAGMGSLYRSAHEFVVVFKVGGSKHINNVELGKFGRNRTNVWTYPCANTFSKTSEEGNLLALHPTPKPVALVMDALLDCSKPKGIVLDPFLGSGTTLIAAQRTDRICYAIEIDPLYVDTAIRRWQALTGKKAVHEASGRLFDEMLEVRSAADAENIDASEEVSHG